MTETHPVDLEALSGQAALIPDLYREKLAIGSARRMLVRSGYSDDEVDEMQDGADVWREALEGATVAVKHILHSLQVFGYLSDPTALAKSEEAREAAERERDGLKLKIACAEAMIKVDAMRLDEYRDARDEAEARIEETKRKRDETLRSWDACIWRREYWQRRALAAEARAHDLARQLGVTPEGARRETLMAMVEAAGKSLGECGAVSWDRLRAALEAALAASPVPPRADDTTAGVIRAARLLAEYAQANGFDVFKWKLKVQTEGEDEEAYEVSARAALSASATPAGAARGTDGWEPIDATTPRNRTLLLAHQAAVLSGWWDEEAGGWVDGCTDAFEELTTYPVTHWREPPPLPVSTATEGE